MTTKSYQISVPGWLWERWKHTVDDLGDYDRYNERLIEHMLTDVQQNGGFDATSRRRADELQRELGGGDGDAV